MSITKWPWKWEIHDYSAASLHGPDEMYDSVMTISPCDSCLEYLKKDGGEVTWAFGRCITPKIEDAIIIEAAPELYDHLKKIVKNGRFKFTFAEQLIDRIDDDIKRYSNDKTK